MARRLSSCCCCFTTQTGCLILASLGIIGAAFGILTTSLNLSPTTGSAYRAIQAYRENAKDLYDHGKIAEKQYRQLLETLDTLKQAVPYVFGSALVSYVISLSLNVMLLVGVVRKHTGLIVPWLIIEMISLVLIAFSAIVGGVFIMVWGNVVVGLILWAVCIPVLGLGFYFWRVVKSTYHDIYDEIDSHSEFGSKTMLA